MSVSFLKCAFLKGTQQRNTLTTSSSLPTSPRGLAQFKRAQANHIQSHRSNPENSEIISIQRRSLKNIIHKSKKKQSTKLQEGTEFSFAKEEPLADGPMFVLSSTKSHQCSPIFKQI